MRWQTSRAAGLDRQASRLRLCRTSERLSIDDSALYMFPSMMVQSISLRFLGRAESDCENCRGLGLTLCG